MASYRSLFIFFFSMSVLLAVLIGIIPHVLETNLTSTFQLKSKPHSDNTKIWANFPGELATSLKHSFQFFTMKDQKAALAEGNITIEESVAYDNFAFDAKTDQITFDAKKAYKFSEKQLDIKVNTLSMGMLELFETITNYPIYQKGIIAINYVLYQVFGTPETFIRKLFAVTSKKDLMYDKERIKETLLFSIKDEAKKDKIINNPTYGLFSKGYIKWVYLIGKDVAALKEETWLTQDLGLTDDEIALLLGKKSFLKSYFNVFNEKLKTDCKCPKNPCGNEIIFLQLQNQTITRLFGFDNIKELNDYLDPSSYPFEHSIEMFNYFKLISPEPKMSIYNNLTLSLVQFEKLLLDTSDGCILNTVNAINLLDLNATSNLYSAYNSFLIKSVEQLAFITNYFFAFLPKNMLFGKIAYGEKTFSIEPLSKGYISLVQMLVDSTYGKLKRRNYFLNILYSLILVRRLNKHSTFPILCPRILQRVLGDPGRVRAICSKENFNMKNEKGLQTWIHGYLCLLDDCKSGIIEEIKKTLTITDTELAEIYSIENLGEDLAPTHEEIIAKYNCGKTCSNDYLTDLQYKAGSVTSNPPDTIKDLASDSISLWDKASFPVPIELAYYQKKEKCSDKDCNEKSNTALMSLYQLSSNLFLPENLAKFQNKITFEKIHSLLVNGIEASAYAEDLSIMNAKNFFKVIDTMIRLILFNEKTMMEYDAKDILLGNQAKDAVFLNLLRAGSPIENYKPTIQKTTGFDFGSSDEKKQPTSYTILTAQNDKTQILRRLFKINQTPFISINKLDYSMTQKEMVPIHASLFDFYPINKANWLSDGFQFDTKQKSIFFYDELSSRVLRFDYKNTKMINKLYCYEYYLNANISQGIMEKEDLIDEKIGQMAQKFNKPFVLSTVNAAAKVDKGLYKDSTICVDPYSNMVIESNITLVYSIYTKRFDVLNSALKKNEMIPLIYYQRAFGITNQTTYEETFKGVLSYFTWRLVLIIAGCGLIAGLFAMGVYFLIQHMKRLPNPSGDIKQASLLPSETA